jgi:hypothetical protein
METADRNNRGFVRTAQLSIVAILALGIVLLSGRS